MSQWFDIHYEVLALIDGVIDINEFGKGVGNKLRRLPTKYQEGTWRWIIDAFEMRMKARHINSYMEKLYHFCWEHDIELKLFDPRKEKRQ